MDNNSNGISDIMLKNIMYPPKDKILAAPSEMASSKAIEKGIE